MWTEVDSECLDVRVYRAARMQVRFPPGQGDVVYGVMDNPGSLRLRATRDFGMCSRSLFCCMTLFFALLGGLGSRVFALNGCYAGSYCDDTEALLSRSVPAPNARKITLHLYQMKFASCTSITSKILSTSSV